MAFDVRMVDQTPHRTLIDAILSDHEVVESLFKQYEQAADAGIATLKQQCAYDIVRTMSKHAAKEEMTFYPRVRSHVQSADADHLNAEAQQLKQLVKAIERYSGQPDSRDLHLVVMDTIKVMREHMREEEQHFLPALGKAATQQQLQQYGREFDAASYIAPTRSHPMAPQEPFLNIPLNAAAAAVDHLWDLARFGLTPAKV